MSHAGDEPPFYRIATNGKHDRNGRSRLLGRQRRSRPRGIDEVDVEPNQLSREVCQLIRAVRIARLELDVLALDPSELPHCVQEGLRNRRTALSQKTDAPYLPRL